MSTTYDLAVVGAGPAGRALAHRGVATGLRVAVVDPAPDRAWTATYGVYTHDLPDWIDRAVVAASSPTITVYTPSRRVVPHGYAVLDAAALQRALTVDGADVVTAYAHHVSATTIRCSEGTVITARHVVDARGARTCDHRHRPRQTAAGTIVDSGDPETVLMDWRRPPSSPDKAPASFSYRIPLGGGRRLVEETCLAGAPPIDVDLLAARNRGRVGVDGTDETVDFPLLTDSAPWRRITGDPLRFGAAGGLMHPATGYSVGASLSRVDAVAEAIAAGRDPHRSVWPLRARLAYRLRTVGLAVLLALSPSDLVRFFDAFFRIDVGLQRRYLCGHDDAVGVVRAMVSVFVRLPARLRFAVAAATVSRGRR